LTLEKEAANCAKLMTQEEKSILFLKGRLKLEHVAKTQSEGELSRKYLAGK